MTRSAFLLIAASFVMPAAATAGSDDPPVVLVVPPKYKKYEDHLPTHLDVFRADDEGKKAAMKIMYGSGNTAAFSLKTARMVVVIGEVHFRASPKKTEYSGFGGAQRGTTEYTVYFRPTAAAKPQQLLTGSVWTDHNSPSAFQDGYIAHLKYLPEALNDELGRAFFAKVATAKPKDVRDPDRAGGFDGHGGALSAKAYQMDRVKGGNFEFVKVAIDNKLPVTVGYESLEIINAVTGKSWGMATPGKKESTTTEPNKVREMAFRLPKEAPKEDALMRTHKFFVVVPE